MPSIQLFPTARIWIVLLNLAGLWITLAPTSLFAHAPGENYVWLNIDEDQIVGRFEIHLNDLENKLGIPWKEHAETPDAAVAATASQVQEYLREHFQIRFGDEPIKLVFDSTDIFNENSSYAQYFYHTESVEVPSKFTIFNDIFIASDEPLHRSLIVLEYNRLKGEEYSAENAIMAFGPHNPEQELDLDNLPALLKPLQFIWQGVLHIWIGIDHILFLVALLFLAVMDREDGKWVPVRSFGKAFWNVLKIVTIFTVAHSITLSLAALDLLNVSSRIIESTIALSIALVCLNNIFTKFNDKTWLVIFFFGLFHGMGFASVMGELPFRTVELTKILLSFNFGVELGQLAIVAAVFPLIYFLRRKAWYRPVVVVGGSLLIGAISLYWFYERAFT